MEIQLRPCPYCAEDIEDSVAVCPYCESDVTVTPTASVEATEAPKAKNSTGRTLVIAGALALLLGAYLPWASITSPFFGTISIAGYEVDGIFSGVIGLILLIGALITHGKPGRPYSVAATLLAIVAAIIVFPKFILPTSLAMGSIGSGLFVSAMGVFLAAVGGLVRVPER